VALTVTVAARVNGHEKAPRFLVPDVGPRETGRFRERQLLAQLLHAERSIAVVLLRDAAERIAGAGTLTEPCRANVTKRWGRFDGVPS